MLLNHSIPGLLSVALGAVAYVVYLWKARKKGTVHPHPISWLLWFLATAVVFQVQRSAGAGPGSWVTGLTATVCLFIGLVSLLRETWSFDEFDWLSLFLGLSALACYLIWRKESLSALLATTADLCGYGPTVRKALRDPKSDSALSFSLNAAKFIPAIIATRVVTFSTCVYPISIIIANFSVALLLLLSRHRSRLRTK